MAAGQALLQVAKAQIAHLLVNHSGARAVHLEGNEILGFIFTTFLSRCWPWVADAAQIVFGAINSSDVYFDLENVSNLRGQPRPTQVTHFVPVIFGHTAKRELPVFLVEKFSTRTNREWQR